ncbi:hypothetical protein [Pontibacter lucknowensis]|uniref:Uncharacterized protein n=1 Tax=Pontibacter lucknowensis TaxID=1077936 RepID=A0A1N6Z1G0_9BACT|nr:hypothetical protein [Pontibacter lucknowensis]SIR20640.1 hypothetical protein SAMN05421545_2684 [Pontibacter lucknowensis]
MKKLYTISTALLMLAGTFTSCTKDLDEVGLNASSIDAAKKEVSADNGNDKLTPVITVTYSPSTAIVGQPVTMTITATAPDGTILPKGELMLQQLIGTEWVQIVKSESIIYTFTPESVGFIYYNIKYIGAGGNIENINTFRSQLEVVASCQKTELTGRLIDSETKTGLEDKGAYTQYTVEYTFNSCININDAKIQGGLTAFTEFVSAVDGNDVGAKEEDTAIGNDKSNSKISWQLGNLTSGYSNTFTITFKNFKNNQEGEITGDWSVEGTNDTGKKIKIVAPPVTVN